MLKTLFFVVISFGCASFSFAEKRNVLLICIDDLRPELGCYGADYISSPRIDSLAAEGRRFQRHYVQAPTCGASRFALLTGKYGPAQNDGLFLRAENLTKKQAAAAPTLPGWLLQQGYTTVSVGKVSHHPGGRGGENWDSGTELELPFSWTRHLMPSGPWQHPRGAMHALANGEIRVKPRDMDVFQSFDGPDTTYPDGLIAEMALKEMGELAKGEKPFFLAVGLIRPHLPFGAPAKYMEHYKGVELPPIPHPEKPEGKTTWHGSGEFTGYNRWGRDPRKDAEFATEVRRHYAAAVSYADAQVGKLIDRLQELGLEENTVVVLWGDHGFHLGEHSVWGKHTLFEESLHAPLIICSPDLEQRGKPAPAIVETIDIYPTICDLAGLKKPKGLDGSSLLPQLENPAAKGRAAISYTPKAATIRTKTHRLISHADGSVELYDHRAGEGETRNIFAEQPELVAELKKQLAARRP